MHERHLWHLWTDRSCQLERMRRKEKDNLDVSNFTLRGNAKSLESRFDVWVIIRDSCKHSKDEGGNVNFHLMSLKQILLREIRLSFYGHVMVINSRTRANTEIQMNLSSDFEIRYFSTARTAAPGTNLNVATVVLENNYANILKHLSRR